MQNSFTTPTMYLRFIEDCSHKRILQQRWDTSTWIQDNGWVVTNEWKDIEYVGTKTI